MNDKRDKQTTQMFCAYFEQRMVGMLLCVSLCRSMTYIIWLQSFIKIKRTMCMQVEKTIIWLDGHFWGTCNAISKFECTRWTIRCISASFCDYLLKNIILQGGYWNMPIHVFVAKIMYVRHISCLHAQRITSMLLGYSIKTLSFWKPDARFWVDIEHVQIAWNNSYLWEINKNKHMYLFINSNIKYLLNRFTICISTGCFLCMYP